MPLQARAQPEIVGQAVRADRPRLDQVRDDVALLIQLCQAIEKQGTKRPVYLIVLAQKRVQVLGIARHPLHECAAPVGHGHRGEVIGGVAQQGSQQHEAEDGDRGLPAKISAQLSR